MNTPSFSGAWTRRLGTGWTLSTIYTIRTGVPLSTVAPTDNALNGFAPSGANPIPQRGNQLLPNVFASNQGQSCSFAPCVNYLNPLAVGIPVAGTYGNMGVGDIRSPGFWEWDQSISRQFPIRERVRLEFRAEGFNLTNSVRLGSPNLTAGGGNFGQITSSQPTTGGFGSGGRILQLAIKVVF